MEPEAGPAMHRGARDYALVLGVVAAGDGTSGAGAEARARAFLDWLVAPEGGGLPGNHVHALIGPEATIGAASLRQMLYELIPDLDDQMGSGGAVGRRCYLYLAGPAVQLRGELRLVARDASAGARMIDASFQRFVSYLRTTRPFDEVVAFADVERVSWATERTPRLPVFPDSEPAPRGVPADAFAAVSAPNAYPATLGFTGAIIEALSGAAVDETGAITADSFIRFVGPRVRRSLGPTEEMPRYEYTTSPPFVFVRPQAPAQAAPTSEVTTPPRMPNAHALLVGVDDYVTIPGLSGCADGARALAAALATPNVGGYDPRNVRVLTDREATRDALAREFARLAEQTDVDSTVLLWFSGRAFVGDDGATTIFLSDDDLPDKGLSAARLDAELDKLRSRRVVVIFDTSGGCAGMAVHVGRVLLSATLPEEAAYSASDGVRGGDFTGAILRALHGGAVSSGDDLSVFDVFEYAHARVVTYGRQHPTIGMRWGEIGFPIAKRPLAPTVPNAADADGFAYDVHVVHSLKSPRAGFVESVLLPALRDAGLRVAVSAWLETSPVGRVVQMQRGLERSRRTLVLDSRASSGDSDFDDVLRLALGSRPPLIDRSQLVVLALEGGRSLARHREVVSSIGETLVIETEPFDLISAQTARHGSIKKLIDVLQAPLPPRPAPATDATPNVPLVEDTSESTPPHVWPLSPDESTTVLSLAVTTQKRAAVRTIMQKGDVVLLTDAVDPVRIVGVTRVEAAFGPVASTTVTAGAPRAYDFALPVRLSSPVVVSTDTVSIGYITMQVAAAVVQNGPPAEREMALATLVGATGLDALKDLLATARSIVDPIDRGIAIRSVAWVARTFGGPNVAFLLDALRADSDPAVRALAPSPAEREPPFLNACFFDATLERNRVVKIGGTLGVQLQRWRAEPLYVHEKELTPFEQTVGVMRQSACIVLIWSSEMADDEWHALMREAVAIDDSRRAHVSAQGATPVPSLVTLIMDGPNALPHELAGRPTIDVTGLTSASDEAMIGRVTAQLLDTVLAASQLLMEHPPGALPHLSHEEALARIEIVAGDLLETDVDAIVNPIGKTATETGEIGYQLFDRIGTSMLASLERHDSLVAGEARLTLTAGRIPARYIIHACTEDRRRGHTVESVTVGALGAVRAAEALPSVRSIALPALGSGASRIPPADVAGSVLARLVKHLTHGSAIERVRFVVHDDARAAYRAALDALRNGRAAAVTVNADRWYLSLRQVTLGSPLVGSTVALALSFSREEQPGATPLDIPYSAFELTVYVDSTSAFHLDGSSQRTVLLSDGNIETPSLPLRLLALASGTHTIRVTAHARGARTAGTQAVLTCTVTVEPPILLPDIPELIDRRTIPSPQPDVVLYIATEPTARSQRLRIHLTCAALGFDRRRLETVLPLDAGDAAAIRLAAADAASDLDGSAPPDARAAILAFGATLYDVLVPPGHELRAIFARLLALPTRGDRPLSWLVVSDEAAALPWELVCPHGYAADATHWYDEPLAARFAIAHWISRRGFEMPNEAPVGPLGVVHYGQRRDTYVRWRDAIGADLASEANRQLGLDILRRGSEYFGVHLLRFTDADEAGRITEAAASSARDVTDPLAGERRLDFTLRRPIVSLSLVDDALDHGAPSVRRYTNIEPAWVAPFLLARSSAVVGPRWTTAPTSDRLFYRVFYDAVRADRPLGLAVWEAREALRVAYPDRADWLAYTYFGHPSCEPYPVESAEGFTLFEPMGLSPDEPFVSGRDYMFRASFRSELPAWYNGRRHVRTTRLRGDAVQVLVAPLHGGQPITAGLIAASGGDAESDDDYYLPVILSMPNEAGTYKWFVQFTRDDRELRSTVITLDVIANERASAARLEDAIAREVVP